MTSIFLCVQTRLLTTQLASELVERSGLFRLLLSAKITEFLEQAVGFRQSKPLPDPPEDAKALREIALENLETWNEDYGTSLPQAICLLLNIGPLISHCALSGFESHLLPGVPVKTSS